MICQRPDRMILWVFFFFTACQTKIYDDGRCYWMEDDLKTKTDARDYCKKYIKGHLMDLESTQHWDFMKNLLQ